MFADAREVPTDTILEADLCVIGAGAAGITLAREFMGMRLRVLVLESGDFEYDADTQALYYGPVTGLPYFPLAAARLRYFGGTTNHWGGVCRPFDEIDFEARDGIPYTGWPIRLSDVEPYYAPAAKVCGLSSHNWDVDFWARHDGFSPLLQDSERIVTRLAQLVPKSDRSFGERYRAELGRVPNVTLYLHANVTGIETDAAGSTVTSVKVATLSGRRFFVRANQFVLAIGAIENARLLLVSRGRAWPDGLGNRHDLVGRFFSEHPRFAAGSLAVLDPNLRIGFYESHDVGDARTRAYLSPSADVQRAENLLDVQIRLTPVYHREVARAVDSSAVESLKTLLDGENDEPTADLGQHLKNVLADLSRWQTFSVPGAPIPIPYPEVIAELLQSTRNERERLIPTLLGDIATAAYVNFAGAPLKSVLLTTRIEQAPNPDSRVTLIEERDQLGMRRVALNWQLSDIDKHNARRALEILSTEVGSSGLGRVKIFYNGDEAGWPKDLAGGWHLMGTTRMHGDPKQGVVDQHGRVHGMANLYVAGSSIFPTGGSGTPTLTLVALALRLAKRLKEAWR
jgi:choline dehydrogenase-like flavoprotein